jgi:hypothetical protein
MKADEGAVEDGGEQSGQTGGGLGLQARLGPFHTLRCRTDRRMCRWQCGSFSAQWHIKVTVLRLANLWRRRKVNFCPWFLIVLFLWSIAPPSKSSLR